MFGLTWEIRHKLPVGNLHGWRLSVTQSAIKVKQNCNVLASNLQYNTISLLSDFVLTSSEVYKILIFVEKRAMRGEVRFPHSRIESFIKPLCGLFYQKTIQSLCHDK